MYRYQRWQLATSFSPLHALWDWQNMILPSYLKYWQRWPDWTIRGGQGLRSPNRHQPKKKPITIRRGEGGGAARGGPLWPPGAGVRSSGLQEIIRARRAAIKAPTPPHAPP